MSITPWVNVFVPNPARPGCLADVINHGAALVSYSPLSSIVRKELRMAKEESFYSSACLKIHFAQNSGTPQSYVNRLELASDNLIGKTYKDMFITLVHNLALVGTYNPVSKRFSPSLSVTQSMHLIEWICVEKIVDIPTYPEPAASTDDIKLWI